MKIKAEYLLDMKGKQVVLYGGLLGLAHRQYGRLDLPRQEEWPGARSPLDR